MAKFLGNRVIKSTHFQEFNHNLITLPANNSINATPIFSLDPEFLKKRKKEVIPRFSLGSGEIIHTILMLKSQ